MNLPNPLPFLHAATTSPPTLDFIVPGFIPGTVAGLVSPGGTGKSFFALELACAVAGFQRTPFPSAARIESCFL